MQITLKQMRYYTAVLAKGSFAHAAKEMEISQSSIVSAIGAIETLLGQPLFTRMPARGLIATDLGVEVGRRFEGFLRQAEALELELGQLVGTPSGTLKLGCYAPSAPYVLPTVMTALRKELPQMRVELREGDFARIADMLSTGEIDMALTYERHMPDRTPFQHLFNARPWALIPNASPLSGQASVTLEQLAELPMVLLDIAGTERYFRGLFESRGLEMRVSHSSKSGAVVRGLVGAGFGFSVLNICGPQDQDGSQGYVARPLRGDWDAPGFGVSYSAAAERSPLVMAVLRTCASLNEAGAFGHLIAPEITD